MTSAPEPAVPSEPADVGYLPLPAELQRDLERVTEAAKHVEAASEALGAKPPRDDRSAAERVHAIMPGVPAHHAYAAVRALRAMGWQAPQEAERLPVTKNLLRSQISAAIEAWEDEDGTTDVVDAVMAVAAPMLDAVQHETEIRVRDAEREQIRRLAIDRGAVYCERRPCTCIRLGSDRTIRSFADLIPGPRDVV